jgi:Domain of unknown function (DUF4157)
MSAPAAKAHAPAEVQQRSKTEQRAAGALAGANPLWLRLATGAQAKLAVSSPDDPLERQADQVADRVMRMPAPQVQRACSGCAGGGAARDEGEEGIAVQRQAAGATGSTAVPDDFRERLGAGRPLEPGVRAFFEPRFGSDFGAVRVHTGARADASARSIDALAFTLGPRVAFRAGAYAPETAAGRGLLAHELAHVVQQGAAKSEGSVQRLAASSRPVIQRACPKTPTGLGRTPPPERCEKAGPGAVSGSVFYYCQDSVELTEPGQEELLEKLVSRARFASVIAVHGSASVEGPEGDYNDNLACRRAADMARRLRAAGVAVPIALYSHGATTAHGTAQFNRNVVVHPFYPRMAKSFSVVSWISPAGLLDFSKFGVAMTPPSVRPIAAISMILKCTANTPPPKTLDQSGLTQLIASKEYRAIQHYEFRMSDQGEIDVDTRQIVGFTAPSRCGCDDVPPCDYMQGETSPLNYATFKSPTLDALMKFRVSGAEEEAAIKNRPRVPVAFGGLSLSMLSHVPWVWAEASVRLQPSGKLAWLINGSAFPTHTVYVDGQKVAQLDQRHPIVLVGSHIRTADQPRQTLDEEAKQRDVPITRQTDTVRAIEWTSGEN